MEINVNFTRCKILEIYMPLCYSIVTDKLYMLLLKATIAFVS